MAELLELEDKDCVEAFGLVSACHLNGKFGVIIEEATVSTNGRVTVKFFDDTQSGLVHQPGPAKLIKPTELKKLKILPGKDHPGFWFLVGDERVLVRIERGEGKSCVDCGYDLGGKYYVYHRGEYRCEEHFAILFD